MRACSDAARSSFLSGRLRRNPERSQISLVASSIAFAVTLSPTTKVLPADKPQGVTKAISSDVLLFVLAQSVITRATKWGDRPAKGFNHGACGYWRMLRNCNVKS